MDEPHAGQRVDKWLYFARVVKTRGLATKLAQSRRVRINRQKIDHASRLVRPGDTLTMRLGDKVLVWRVIAIGERRGSATEAQTLYEDISTPDAGVSEDG